MRKYIVEYGIYENCCISNTESRTIEAKNKKEAEAKAEALASEIEEEYQRHHKEAYMENGYAENEVPNVDIWASVEDIYLDR